MCSVKYSAFTQKLEHHVFQNHLVRQPELAEGHFRSSFILSRLSWQHDRKLRKVRDIFISSLDLQCDGAWSLYKLQATIEIKTEPSLQ